MGKTTIAIMDNDIWCLQSLGAWLRGQPQLCTLLWQTSSSDEALLRCLNKQKEQQPQILLLDTSLDTANAPEICRQIRSATDSISILGMPSGMCEPHIEALAQAGARHRVKETSRQATSASLILLSQRKAYRPPTFQGHKDRTCGP